MPSNLAPVATIALAAFPFASFLLWQRGDDASPLAACGCLGFFGVVMVAILALNIALLIWVARDAKSRGMDNSILWMVLVMLTGIIGLIIYLMWVVIQKTVSLADFEGFAVYRCDQVLPNHYLVTTPPLCRSHRCGHRFPFAD